MKRVLRLVVGVEHAIRVRSLVRVALALSVALFAARSVSAQGVEEALRALRAMEIEGLVAFSRDDIAAELARDRETMDALRRRVDDDAAAVVADRVSELHRCGGYAMASATGKASDGVVRIALQAGTRYRAGEVRCSGNTIVGIDELRDRLAARTPPRTPSGDERLSSGTNRRGSWIAGEFPTLDAVAVERVKHLVRAAYRDRGRWGVVAAVEFVPDGDRMTLVVTVADEGHEVRVRSMRLDGEDQEVAKAVLADVGFRADTPATTRSIDGLRVALEATGRYTKVGLALADDAPSALDPLVATVAINPNTPAPGAIAVRDVAQVRAALLSILERLSGTEALCVELELVEPIGEPPLCVLPGSFSCRVGGSGTLIEIERLQCGDHPPSRAFLGLSPRGLVAGYGEERTVWDLDGALAFGATMWTRLQADGEMEARWGASLSRDGSSGLVLDLHPATPWYLLSRAKSVQREGDVLALQLGETLVHIAADGALREEYVRFPREDGQVTVSVRADGLRELDRALAAENSRSRFLALGASILASLLPAEGKSDARVGAMLRGVATATASLDFSGSRDPSTRVPSLTRTGSPSFLAVLGAMLARPLVARTYSERLAAVCSPFALALLGDGGASRRGFDALSRDERVGPLSLMIVAWGAGVSGNEGRVRAFGALAKDRLTFDRFFEDGAALLASFPQLQRAAAPIGASWRAMPELDELLRDLPPGEAGDELAFRKGIEVLWDTGGARLIRKFLEK